MTLYHLYTAAALILALALIFRLFRCAHAWELVDKTEFPSMIDESKRLGYTMNGVQGLEIMQEIYSRRVIVVMRCPKCGAAKILKLRAYD